MPRPAFAQAKPPKRLVVVFSPNGTIYESWKPSGTETNWTLSEILSPLQPFKDKLVVLDGVDVKSARNGLGDDHMRGMGHMLTGIELLPGDTQGGSGEPAGLAGGISIDQQIANSVGTMTRFKSLEFGAFVGSADVWSRMIYAAANQPLPPMENPTSAFTRIFSSVNMDQAAVARLVKRRQSVLDHATGSLNGLATRIGAADRVRVQAHADSVRQIEKQLLATSQTCVAPTVGSINTNQNANYKPTGRLMMDMLAASFGCDQTRVASLQFSRSVSDMTFPDIGISDGHHSLSHDDSTPDTATKLVAINKWYATEFAYLLGKLDSIVESDGTTVLDNTVVVWMNELARGGVHSHSPLPVVLAGKCQGAIRTGRYVTLAGDKMHNNLLVSVANAMGVNINTFGNPAYCTGKLAGL
jgi:hypothetical protein